MPIYGYDCNKCGHEFETLVRSSEPRRAHLAKALT
jgi:putative FmdB family regulatory protein